MGSCWAAYLIIIWTICTFFDAGVFLLVADLYTNYWIHIESGQLSRFNDCHTNLKILCLEVFVNLC